MFNPGSKEVAARLTAVMKHQGARADRTDFKVTLPPRAAARYVVMQRIRRRGRSSLALALYPRARGYPSSIALRSDFDVRPRVELRLEPECGLVGEPVSGVMLLHLDESAQAGADIVFTIRPQGRPVLCSRTCRRADAEAYSIQFPTSPLGPGAYEFEARVVAKKTLASGKFFFTLVEDF